MLQQLKELAHIDFAPVYERVAHAGDFEHEVIAFLTSDAAGAIHGAAIPVTGLVG